MDGLAGHLTERYSIRVTGPAERCADEEPVSEFAGHAVPVTGFVDRVRSEKPAALTLLDDHLLLDEVGELDDCVDLPHAFVHPDFVPANAITTAQDTVVIVDWAGAGRGPRLWSLGFLLWAAGMRSPKLVELVVSRYRRHVTLEPDELSRLAGAIKARPLLIDCWSVVHGRKPAAEVSGSLRFLDRNAERIAAQAVALFTAPEPP